METPRSFIIENAGPTNSAWCMPMGECSNSWRPRRRRRTKTMENAHLRLGLLEHVRITEKTSTRIRLRVDRYLGEDRQAHLLSVFGNDSDVGAMTAAFCEKSPFSPTL